VREIFFKDGLSGLFLDLEQDSHLLEFIFELGLHIIWLILELIIDLIDLHLIWFLLSCLSKMLVHLHETLGPDVDFLQHVLFHADVMLLVVSKESTVRADTLLAVDADDFDFALMHWAHVTCIFYYLRNSSIRCYRHRPSSCTRVIW